MRRLIVGITGASGAIYGIRTLEALTRLPEIEAHLVISSAGMQTIVEETGRSVADVRGLADATYSDRDIGAAVASGSFRADGMLIAPCSIKTLSAVANSRCDTLVARAADVCLKERRRLVLLVRETPLHLGHIEMMERAVRYGAVVMPPVPAFYHRPQTIDDIVDQTVGRALDLFDIDAGLVRRWKDDAADDDAAGKVTPLPGKTR